MLAGGCVLGAAVVVPELEPLELAAPAIAAPPAADAAIIAATTSAFLKRCLISPPFSTGSVRPVRVHGRGAGWEPPWSEIGKW
jgi:hypothetical protein